MGQDGGDVRLADVRFARPLRLDESRPTRLQLVLRPAADGFRPFPYESMYQGSFPRTKMLSPSVDVRMTGEATVDGRKVVLRDAPGMQAHLYGTRHAASWVWCHVNAWDGGRQAWIEGVTCMVALAMALKVSIGWIKARIAV